MSKDIIDRLPSRYRMIEAIPSPYLRTKLASDIETIGVKIEELKQLELTEDKQQLIRRFLNYFSESCENHVVMKRRCGWLGKYATATLDAINRIQNKAYQLSKTINPDTASHFDTLALTLSENVHEFVTLGSRSFLPHDLICKFLSSIIDEMSNVIPDLNDPRYLLIAAKISTLNDRLVQILSIPNCQYFDDEFLSGSLKEIDYLTKRYVLGWSF